LEQIYNIVLLNTFVLSQFVGVPDSILYLMHYKQVRLLALLKLSNKQTQRLTKLKTTSQSSARKYQMLSAQV